MAMTATKDSRLDVTPASPGYILQKEFANEMVLLMKYYQEQVQPIWENANIYWDLFLAIEEDKRDPVDEAWRSDAFIPLPFITSRTKTMQQVDLLGNAEPVWQVESTQEKGPWYEESKTLERLVEYPHRFKFRKFLYKLFTARSVQGSAFFKLYWTKRSHAVTLYGDPDEQTRFQTQIAKAQQSGAPMPPPLGSKEFDAWRELVNESDIGQQIGGIPAQPMQGAQEAVEYEGPVFQYIPLWHVFLDPFVDELTEQPVIIHRTIKPYEWVEARADDAPSGPNPYYLENVKSAMNGWSGEILGKEEAALADSLGLTPPDTAHPLYSNPVELLEIWAPEFDYKYAIVMNRSVIINKRPFEHPLLTEAPNIFMLRNIIVPGHAYGLSDYQEPFKLFKELIQFRRLRLDGATLTTLPVFVKQAGYTLNEAMRSLRPGMVITAPTKDAITSLIRHTLPAEAYREPQEIKAEIEEATEVYGPQKGAPATIGRITGTEFQGRESHILLKSKVDAGIIEEEIQDVPNVILSMFAQMGTPQLRRDIGGDPDTVAEIARDRLVQRIGTHFRMRGATKNISPDLQVQQITTAVNNFKDALTVAERRFALQLILELMDVRGYSKILSLQGGQQMQQQSDIATGAQDTGNLAAGQAAAASLVLAPNTLPPEEAAALAGAGAGAPGSGPGGPPPPGPPGAPGGTIPGGGA